MNENQPLTKPFWKRTFSPWLLGVILIFAWGIPRFWLVLEANRLGSYQWIPLVFITMALTPFLFFTKAGRLQMDWRKPDNKQWLGIGFLFGMACSTAIYGIGQFLFGSSIENWYVYIAQSYSNVPNPLSDGDRMTYFLIYATMSMLFSPIGEELFYRGVVHELLATRWGDNIASRLDSLAFALTHLAHFGIVYYLGKWQLLPIPAFLWIVLLFITCRVFFLARKKSGSILGAIVAHAGFNFGMVYWIFYGVL